jgi:hypothetical protein
MDNESELKKYFDFDESDLFANRNGYLSPRQQARDKKDARDTKRILYTIGFILLALAFLPVIIFLLVKGHWQSWSWILILLPIGIFGSIILFRLAVNTSTEDTLKTIEGKVNIIKEENEDEHLHKYYDYYWKIGGVKFDVVDTDKVELLEQGDTYRVYFLDLAKQILSLEKITKEKYV